MVQGPQHMLPSTWRTSQWLAWGCYPVLALLALGRVGLDRSRALAAGPGPAGALMGVNLASLGLAYLAVEVVGDLRVTIFQPFRMATLARGLALMAVSGRVVGLWEKGGPPAGRRAVLMGVGLAEDAGRRDGGRPGDGDGRMGRAASRGPGPLPRRLGVASCNPPPPPPPLRGEIPHPPGWSLNPGPGPDFPLPARHRVGPCRAAGGPGRLSAGICSSRSGRDLDGPRIALALAGAWAVRGGAGPRW